MQQADARLDDVTVYVCGVQVVDAHFGYTHLLCFTLWKSGENTKLDRNRTLFLYSGQLDHHYTQKGASYYGYDLARD